ncbi:MAG: hypothetical protein LBP91_06165 [Coriobacteriales bacterium]|nr:hypothetical protein [Coriobacteriales bacterium]
MVVSFDSLVKDALADPESVEIFEDILPGISTNPAMKMIGGMPISAAVKLPQSGFTPEMIEELKSRLA